jgi:hypothetical protein
LYSIRFRLWQIERFLLQSDLRSPSRISRVSVDYLTDSETQPRPFIVDDGGFAPVISGPVIFAPGIYISCTRYLPPLHPSTLGPPAPTSTVTDDVIQDPVIRILDQIRQAGFDGIGGLLMRMMESRHDNVKRRVSHLVDSPAAEKFVGLVVKRGRLQNLPDDSDIVKIVVAKMTREAEAIRRDKHCHIGAKGVTPEFINAFSFQSLGLRYAELAPSLWLTICALGDVDLTKAKEYLQAPPEDVANLEHFDGEDDDDDAEEGAGATTPKKKMKDKVLAVITAIAGIVFTRSRNCNASQMMLGYYLFATRTGKRVMGVLNHLGICTSYDTVRRALQGNAEKVQALIIQRCRQDPIALTYDNLTNKHHAASETLLNKSSMQSFTAAGVIFLKLTPSLARRLSDKNPVSVPIYYCVRIPNGRPLSPVISSMFDRIRTILRR